MISTQKNYQEEKTSNNELQAKVDILTQENTELKSSVNEKEKINKILLQDKYEEKTSKNELQTKVNRLIQENKELRSSINDSKNELQSKVDILIKENTELKSFVNEQKRINGIISDDLKKHAEM